MAIEFKRIQLKQDTESNLKSTNEILLSGEPAFELDRIRMKIGDGSTPYGDLPYIGAEEFIIFTSLEDVDTYDYPNGNTYYFWDTGDFPSNNPFSGELDKSGFLWTMKVIDLESTRQLAFHRGSNKTLMRQRTSVDDWTDWQLVFTSEEEDSIQDRHIDWGIGANQVSAVDVPIEDADGYYIAEEVETAFKEIAETEITAGDGLTGGGNLSENRTLTLGTPGTISEATTNSVSATSHTHALGNPYPVGSQYVQYASAASNDPLVALPSSKSPATLFGGTWTKLWDTESVYFRTEGTDADDGRTDGKQLDQMQGHWHQFNWGGNYASGGWPGISAESNISTTKVRDPISDGTNGTPRTGTETRVTGRLKRIWERTA